MADKDKENVKKPSSLGDTPQPNGNDGVPQLSPSQLCPILDPLRGIVGLMARLRAKMMQKALNQLINKVHNEEALKIKNLVHVLSTF